MNVFPAQKVEDKKTEDNLTQDNLTQDKSHERLKSNPEILEFKRNFEGILPIVGALYALENTAVNAKKKEEFFSKLTQKKE